MSVAADGLALAAVPTFAVTALATAVVGGGRMEAICGSAGVGARDGMVVLYVLMSVFHLGPWLRRKGRWR